MLAVPLCEASSDQLHDHQSIGLVQRQGQARALVAAAPHEQAAPCNDDLVDLVPTQVFVLGVQTLGIHHQRA